jgi:hypothetical protein
MRILFVISINARASVVLKAIQEHHWSGMNWPFWMRSIPLVKPYMTEKGIAVIEEFGTWVKDFEGDYTTPCVDTNKECAYVIMENGISKCAIEKAWEDGKIAWKKPISCHLYPIRITNYPEFDVLHYDRWSICSAACAFGKELKVSVYEFLKEPLIRKYGAEWYAELEAKVSK